MLNYCILLFHLFGVCALTNVTVTIVNAPFNECDGSYWTSVSFYFNGEVVEKKINDVCGNRDKTEKTFTVTLQNTTEIQKGNVELQLNEIKTERDPSVPNGLWQVERIVLKTSEFETVIGIGRQVVSSRLYKLQNYDSSVSKPPFMKRQTIQDMELLRVAYDTTPIFGSGPRMLKALNKEDNYQHKEHKRARNLNYYEDAAVSDFKFKVVFDYLFDFEFKSIKEMENFWSTSNFSSLYQTPKIVDYWNEDGWFGAQRLQGSNPFIIRSISAIPYSLRVSEIKVESLIGGEKLSDAFASNKIFLADIQLLHDLDDDIWAPQALFYLHGKKLIPVAIQLTRTARAEDVFYRDESLAWLLAKMYYNCAEFVEMIMVRHLGYSHLFVEAFGIAMNRFLSPSHPIRKLLKPHFYGTFGINYAAPFDLLQKGQIIDQVLQGRTKVALKLLIKSMANIDYNEINPVIDIKTRQVGKDKIPVFPVRDRGIDIYNVLRKFVAGIVNNYYDSDEDVRTDEDLENFRYELSLSTRYQGAGIKNLPGSDLTGEMNKTELVDILTTILYQATAGHTVVNNGGYEQSAIPLNYPTILHKPPPKASDASKIDERYVLKCLSDKKTVFVSGFVLKDLATSVGTPFGEVENQLLYSPKDQKIYLELKNDVERLKNASARYENLDERYPYTILNMDQIVNSIRS